MGMPSFRGFVLSLLASTCLSGQGFALEPSGSVVEVTRISQAAGPGGARVLEDTGPVFMGDEITTNPNGLAQIRFIDDTKIVVGPNSRLRIDTFVFNPDNTARKVTVDAVKGVFRFISGKSPHQAYTIRTPSMTIGIRGTALDIQSHGAGSRVVFLEGSGEGCDVQGQCMQLETGCRLYFVPRTGGIETPDGLDRRLQMSAYFPFVQSQRELDPLFRVNTSSCTSAESRQIEGPPESDSSRNSGTTNNRPPDLSGDPYN